MTIVITIDGPSGAGKSTVAKLLSDRLGFRYLDSGSIYRAVAYLMNRDHIEAEESQTLEHYLETVNIRIDDKGIYANGEEISKKIRTPFISSIASTFSALPQVRKKLLDIQRHQAKGTNLIAEGRDMGTVVFPDAEFKFFITATIETRAYRRWKELTEKNQTYSLEKIKEQITERDKNDSSRKFSPLLKGEDATEIDTTDMTIEEVLNYMSGFIHDELDQRKSEREKR